MSAFLVAVGPFAILCTKVTDFLRNSFDKADTQPKWLWNVVPIVVGIAVALGWQLNFVDLINGLPPVLSRLTGVSGQVLTGAAIGTVAGGWHEVFSALSSVSHNS